MEKNWLKSYPSGVPAEIDIDSVGTVVSMLETAIGAYGSKPAFENFGASMSYQELDTASREFAAYLQERCGLVKGDRIAIMMPNLLQYPIAIFGALRAGLCVVNTNPLYTARELRHQLADSGAKAIVIVENFADVLQEVLGDTQIEKVITTTVGERLPLPKRWLINLVLKYVKKQIPTFDLPGAIAFNQCLREGRQCRYQPVALEGDDLAFLQYTGGTTGLAKGAMLSHQNLAANVAQASAWLKPILEPGRELIITALPLYHIFALTANCLTYMRSGGLNVLITNPRDMPGFVKELQKHRFTAITGVNTLFNALLNTPGFDKVDFGSLKITLGGGMAVQRAVAERWQQVTGRTLMEAYGLTETSPAVCINPLNIEAYNGSIGLPVPSTDLKVVDDAGNELGIDEAGELCVSGPQVMLGYWQRPQETQEVLKHDGWLSTGDIARIDSSGFVFIVDRKKDMIVVSGFNVYPNEIEDVLAAHPGVLEVGAIGVPDEHSGEAVKVIVVKRDANLDEASLREYSREELTGYKRPKHIEFTDELPKSNVGKILRRELREQFGTSTS